MRGEAVKDVKFNRSSFWIQIHGLPTKCQTKEVGMSIDATLGEVEKVDANEKGFCLGSYLRIRVSLDVSVPLCRGRKVRLGEYGLKWVEFRYERLPIFCYMCGKIDHDERDCLMWIRSNDTPRPDEKQFGPWLRASQDKNQKPQLVLTGKNGGIDSGEGGRRDTDKKVDDGVVSKPVPGSGDDKQREETARLAVSRADVASLVDLPAHTRITNPDSSHSSNFE